MNPHAFKQEEAESYGGGVEVHPLHTEQLQQTEMTERAEFQELCCRVHVKAGGRTPATSLLLVCYCNQLKKHG